MVIEKQFTIAGTDINEVKQLNKNSDLSYNEVKALLAEKFMRIRRRQNKMSRAN